MAGVPLLFLTIIFLWFRFPEPVCLLWTPVRIRAGSSLSLRLFHYDPPCLRVLGNEDLACFPGPFSVLVKFTWWPWGGDSLQQQLAASVSPGSGWRDSDGGSWAPGDRALAPQCPTDLWLHK